MMTYQGKNKRQFLRTRNIPLKIFSYYLSCFRNGIIEGITCVGDEIVFEMESEQLYRDDNRYHLPLSEKNMIYGRLHAKGIFSLKKNKQIVHSLKMEYDCVYLISFELEENCVSFCGNWVKHCAKVPYENEIFLCEVIAKEIYWENTANITNPLFLGKYMGLE